VSVEEEAPEVEGCVTGTGKGGGEVRFSSRPRTTTRPAEVPLVGAMTRTREPEEEEEEDPEEGDAEPRTVRKPRACASARISSTEKCSAAGGDGLSAGGGAEGGGGAGFVRVSRWISGAAPSPAGAAFPLEAGGGERGVDWL
jgi:hypothetical protein